MTQVVMTATDAGEGFAVVVTLAILAPPLTPPIAMAYMIGTAAYQQGHWHPLFAILLGLGVLALVATVLLGLLRLMPRWLTAILAGFYVGMTYLVLCAAVLHLDDVWSCAAFVVAAIAAGVFGWFAADATKQHFAA